MITPVFEARRCTRIGSIDGPGGGPAGRTPRRYLTLPGVSGLGRVRSSSRVSRSKNSSVWPRCGSRPGGRRGSPRPGDGGRRGRPGRRGTPPFDLDHVAVPDRRQRRWAGRDGRPARPAGQVVDGQMGADGLDPGAVDGQVDHVAVDPEPHQLTGAGRAEPELLPAERACSPTAAPPSPAPPRHPGMGRVGVGGRVLAGRRRSGYQRGGSHSSSRSRSAAGMGANRCCGVTGCRVSRAWWGRSAL